MGDDQKGRVGGYRLHLKYELIIYMYILYWYLWVIWFNRFSFVLLVFLAALHPKMSLYKFISHLKVITFATQLILFDRNPYTLVYVYICKITMLLFILINNGE